MITEIGIVAGDIWHYLDQHKSCYLNKLASTIDKNKDVVLMSLGWLAREGHVILEEEKGDYKVTLRFSRPFFNDGPPGFDHNAGCPNCEKNSSRAGTPKTGGLCFGA